MLVFYRIKVFIEKLRMHFSVKYVESLRQRQNIRHNVKAETFWPLLYSLYLEQAISLWVQSLSYYMYQFSSVIQNQLSNSTVCVAWLPLSLIGYWTGFPIKLWLRTRRGSFVGHDCGAIEINILDSPRLLYTKLVVHRTRLEYSETPQRMFSINSQSIYLKLNQLLSRKWDVKLYYLGSEKNWFHGWSWIRLSWY